jgi:hypothetical protein
MRAALRCCSETSLAHAHIWADWHRAATLHGAAQAPCSTKREDSGTRSKYVNAPESLDEVAAAIGDEQLRQAYDAGAALSIADAIGLAQTNPPSLERA